MESGGGANGDARHAYGSVPHGKCQYGSVAGNESGMIPEGTVFDRISIGHPEGAEMAVNPESDGTATLTCGGRTLFCLC